MWQMIHFNHHFDVEQMFNDGPYSRNVTMLKGNKVIINCKNIVKCVLQPTLMPFVQQILKMTLTEMPKAIFPSPNTDHLNS